jgi:hypothetical protein
MYSKAYLCQFACRTFVFIIQVRNTDFREFSYNSFTASGSRTVLSALWTCQNELTKKMQLLIFFLLKNFKPRKCIFFDNENTTD